MLKYVIFLVGLLFAGSASADVMRGEYLSRAGDCISCHTQAGHSAYGGGRELKTPFGPIYSTNITPDPQYGIGAYGLKDFDRAVRQGVAKDGHHLYPAMPYPSFRRISDRDIGDLYDYFMHGVQPVHEASQKTRLPFPFNMRWMMLVWNWLFKPHSDFKPQAGRDETWNRGSYLVETLGHCGACHTPRGLAFQENGLTASSRAFLSGGTLEYWHAPSLRGNARRGLAEWSEADIAEYLRTGHARGFTAFGTMSEAVEVSTRYLTDSDRMAIAHYLKSLPAASLPLTPVPNATAGQAEWPGAGIYASDCAGCHGRNGEGRPAAPALAGNPAIQASDPASVVHILLKGSQSPATPFGPQVETMPGFEPKLSDREIAEVATFIRQSWDNRAPAVDERVVRGQRHALKADTPLALSPKS